jgi:hypothetical protein
VTHAGPFTEPKWTDFEISLPQVVSNSDGRFELTDVPPGCDYGLVLEAGTLIKKRRVTLLDIKAIEALQFEHDVAAF